MPMLTIPSFIMFPTNFLLIINCALSTMLGTADIKWVSQAWYLSSQQLGCNRDKIKQAVIIMHVNFPVSLSPQQQWPFLLLYPFRFITVPTRILKLFLSDIFIHYFPIHPPSSLIMPNNSFLDLWEQSTNCFIPSQLLCLMLASPTSLSTLECID